MIGAATAVTAIAVALVAAAPLRAALARRRAPRLPRAGTFDAGVTVLLPVRDEEANIVACLSSLLAQQPPVARVLVLDDGSRDRTAERAAEVARRDERVVVRAVPEPPPGLSGKVHALAHGVRQATGDWILALDADARLAPDAIARALAAARSHGLAAVSLAARQLVGTPGEALLTPLVFGLLDLELGDWRAAARGDGAPVANGQFFLVRRSALAAAGGYAAIAEQPLDDVALARRLTDSGARVGFWRAGRALEVRMYRGLRSSYRGWRRNLALILGERSLLVAAVSSIALLPALALVANFATGNSPGAIVAWAGGVAASALLRAGTGSSPFWALLQPLDSCVFASCLAIAARDRASGRIAAWRGRELNLPAAPEAADSPQAGADNGAA